jgi:hypothetical protein
MKIGTAPGCTPKIIWNDEDHLHTHIGNAVNLRRTRVRWDRHDTKQLGDRNASPAPNTGALRDHG